MTQLNETHDPALSSWLASANDANIGFPVQHLPFAVFRRAASQEKFRPGVALGDQIIDLAQLALRQPFSGLAAEALNTCTGPTLNALMALGNRHWSALRLALSQATRAGSVLQAVIEPLLVPQAQAEYSLPAQIRDYTDFYISIYHATAGGKISRPDAPLLPNFKWLPIGYHGRASSVYASGIDFRRPHGQVKPPGEAAPRLAPSARLDYELELGIVIGRGNEPGVPVTLADAEAHVAGLTLLNDWSARDVQAWEYQPLGPFLAKNFATTVSPWIVTLEALAPFRERFGRALGDPSPLPYLDSPANRESGVIGIELEVWLQTAAMRERGDRGVRLSTSSFRDAYWTLAQLVAHHTVNGCNLGTGDLLGTGTLSGPEPSQGGSLLELSRGGQQPVPLGNGEQRTFLADGDTVILRGYCERPGARRIGFGECRATVLPARAGVG